MHNSENIEILIETDVDICPNSIYFEFFSVSIDFELTGVNMHCVHTLAS